MRFAASAWLWGIPLALLFGVALSLGGWLLVRAVRRFGDEARVAELVTDRARTRRTLKGVFLVLALALAFVASARPQYGRGERLIPATRLDVVVALDYSKSMYARDVAPSRSLRAKTEVARLIADLPGARFAAVAFAGEPMTFPLTSDGSAIAQFLRQLTPNDMPVGGTSLARALEAGRELLSRDPLSSKHARVIVLVTDGEDLEGDPVAVAKAAREEGVTVHVVQIGGRTPEPIPEVDDAERVTGIRRGEDGNPLTTALSAEGEAQLAEVASSGGGRVVRSASGSTGIDEIARSLRQWMNDELSEKVETVYADVYAYPLALSLLLLLAEAALGEAKTKRKPLLLPPPPKRPLSRRRRDVGRWSTAALLGIALAVLPVVLPSCHEPRDPFQRYSPVVDQAIAQLDGGDAGLGTNLLAEYLSTGRCDKGQIGAPDSLNKRSHAALDLGLLLFRVAESYGQRFGEPTAAPDTKASPENEQALARRGEQSDCALRVVSVIAADPELPVELRARAEYLVGNLRFLRQEWQKAVDAYDRALRLVPGLALDAGDLVGRDAAFNRAIALRRLREEPPDAGPDAGQDGGDPNDAGAPDAGDSGSPQPDAGDGDDGGADASSPKDQPGADAGTPPPSPDAGQDQKDQKDQKQPPPDSSESPDQQERVLQMLEDTPTFQEHMAKGRTLRRRPTMEDK